MLRRTEPMNGGQGVDGAARSDKRGGMITSAAPSVTAHFRPPVFSARGPLSASLISLLSGSVRAAPELVDLVQGALCAADRVVQDDDLQLSLFILYGLHYGGVIDSDPEWEWNPDLIAARRTIERAYEAELRTLVRTPVIPDADAEAVAAALFALTEADDGPSLSRYFAREATADQALEFLKHKSIYTLKEADPHSWAIPRLRGRAKAALVEIQADEYGGGRPSRMHSTIFAETLTAAGLSADYGVYVDQVPASTLASFTQMSMFGLNRHLRGAIAGHLAAFEMTSSIPNRFYGNGFRRLGYGTEVTWYFDEHVEADAVHEQIAARDLAGGLAEDEPELIADIMFGAAACLTVDGWMGEHLLDAWSAGRSSLRESAAESGTPDE